MNQYPKREIDLDFNVNEIKTKIDNISKASTGSYMIQDKNDIINTYRISAHSGMMFGIMNITLKKIEDNKTTYITETMPATGSRVDATILSRMQDDFLTILSKALSGEEVNQKLIKENKSGCLGIIILFFLSISFMAFKLVD